MEWNGLSTPGLTLISCRPSEAAAELVVLAECLGVATRTFDPLGQANLAAVLSEAETSPHALVVDLVGLADAPFAAVESVLEGVRGAKADVLLLVAGASDQVSRYLATATGNRVSSVLATRPSSPGICRYTGPVAAELSGYSFPRSSSPALGLSSRPDAFESILSIDGVTSFGRVIDTTQGRSLFVWSTPRVFELRRPLESEAQFELATDEYLPAMMFLRTALRERCWHTPDASAGVVVDDPLLRPSYGALDFRRLLASARQHRYHVTLAFIPWNHWRTRKKDAEFFRDYGDVFSVCAHGNDHTAGEFFSDDFQDLRTKLSEAQARFEAHEASTGVHHEWLMVWPQERYSVQALRALADNGRFVAVSNSRCMPNDPAAKGKLNGADLLLPAPDTFGTPVLKRHYLNEGLGKFAFALFLGRPAILSTHHQFFRSGPGRLEEFVAATRRLNPAVQWRPLTRVLQGLCWQRRVSESGWEAQFFANDFELAPADGSRTYTLSRRIPLDTNVEAVTVNDKRVDFAVRDGTLRLESAVNQQSGIRVRVHLDKKSTAKPRLASRVYRTKVAMRRIGSELRDHLIPGSIDD